MSTTPKTTPLGTLRQAQRTDIPGMHKVRLAVRENALRSTVITEEHYIPAIEDTGRGWVVEIDSQIVGFAVGNAQTGNIWALFVDPDHEARGYGKQLHKAMVTWLFEQGLTRLHLSTASGTRAEIFYKKMAWERVAGVKNGEIFFEMLTNKQPIEN